jgi:hypothetical protein
VASWLQWTTFVTVDHLGKKNVRSHIFEVQLILQSVYELKVSALSSRNRRLGIFLLLMSWHESALRPRTLLGHVAVVVDGEVMPASVHS